MKKIARKLTGRKKPFDIDGDGRVTMADFAAIFTGKFYKETSSVDFVRDRASEIWGKNEHHFTLLLYGYKNVKLKSEALLNA